jgi:hypothetical protein
MHPFEAESPRKLTGCKQGQPARTAVCSGVQCSRSRSSAFTKVSTACALLLARIIDYALLDHSMSARVKDYPAYERRAHRHRTKVMAAARPTEHDGPLEEYKGEGLSVRGGDARAALRMEGGALARGAAVRMQSASFLVPLQARTHERTRLLFELSCSPDSRRSARDDAPVNIAPRDETASHESPPIRAQDRNACRRFAGGARGCIRAARISRVPQLRI